MRASVAKNRLRKYKLPKNNEEILKEIKLMSLLGFCNFSLVTNSKTAKKAMDYFANKLGYDVVITHPNSDQAELEIRWN